MSAPDPEGSRAAGDFVGVAAAGSNGLLRYAGGIGVVLVAYLVATAAAALGIAAWGGASVADVFARRQGAPAVLVFALAPSLVLLVATLVAVPLFHARSPLSVLTAARSLRWGRVVLGAAVWTGLTAAFELVAWGLDSANYRLDFEPGRFVPVALVGLVLLPLQSAGEEVFFRGYLFQALGVRTRRPWIALLVTAVAFGLVHAGNPEMDQFGHLFLVYYVAMGLVLGLVTVLDGGLELAIGAHAGNNLYGALVVSFPGSVLDLPAIFRMAHFPAGLMGGFGAATGLLFVALLSRWLGWHPSRLWTWREAGVTEAAEAVEGAEG